MSFFALKWMMQCHLKKMPKVRVAAIFLPNITRFKFAQIKTFIWIVEAVNCLFPSSSPDLFSWKGKWKQLKNNCFHFHDKHGYFGILIAFSFTFLPAKQCVTLICRQRRQFVILTSFSVKT